MSLSLQTSNKRDWISLNSPLLNLVSSNSFSNLQAIWQPADRCAWNSLADAEHEQLGKRDKDSEKRKRGEWDEDLTVPALFAIGSVNAVALEPGARFDKFK
jgi:hypothetical protein